MLVDTKLLKSRFDKFLKANDIAIPCMQTLKAVSK